ncbi:MAG: hypothetical protein F6K32_20510, partial [Desertifilum sp. SIO1I2]|nr:hypothetical protein [Desertifilum sp. SIO1I2]
MTANTPPSSLPLSEDVATPTTPVQTPEQYQVSDQKVSEEVDMLVTEEKTETDIDLEFLYTRDIEFRQETLYFIVVDRFHDGDPDNSE